MIDAQRPSRPRRQGLAVLLVLLVGVAGCGESVPAAGKTHPLKGKFEFSKPEAFNGLKVQFIPNSPSARPATTEIKSDGTFEIPGDGIAEGDYRVGLMKPAGTKGKPASPIAPEFFDEDGSYLQTSIKPDTTEVSFDLNKPPAGAPAKGRGAGRNRIRD